MQRCQALVFPSRDDFGLIPVEVMACGRPVLAYAGGGSLYTSFPGITGELFAEQTADAIEAALRGFDPGAYDPAPDPRARPAVGQPTFPRAPRRARQAAAAGASLNVRHLRQHRRSRRAARRGR